MATPIAPTPILEGQDAADFWEVDSDEDKRVPLTPTDDLEKIREKMLADDRDTKK